MNHESIGIIILNWNSSEVTCNCLMDFVKQGMNYSIIVVDNGSSDDSVVCIKAKFPNITIIESPTNVGFAGGNNLGIRYCLDKGYEYVMLLNNDTLFDEDFVAPMVQFLEQNDEVGAIQPKIYFNHDRSIIWNGGTKFNPFSGETHTYGEGKKDNPAYNKIKKVPWITGCCILIRKSVIEKVGLLDEQFFIYYEDVDWSFRVAQAGLKLVYFPKTKIYHIAGVSQKRVNKTRDGYLKPSFHHLNIRNQIFIIRRYCQWYHLPTVAIYFFAKISIYLAYFLFRLRFEKAKMLLLGFKDGLGNFHKNKTLD
ncbi:MAG: glycosyltransferase family 2 protein [Reichenbachiella sp.]